MTCPSRTYVGYVKGGKTNPAEPHRGGQVAAPHTGVKQANGPMSTVGQVLSALEHDGYGAYVELDVHSETIAVAVARPGRDPPENRGEIRHTDKALAELVQRLDRAFGGEVLLFCEEAGPCGDGLHRRLLGWGHGCELVAPSLIANKPGERIKTERRDARRLALALRSGELTAIWVPDDEAGAMRDLTRTCEDFKHQQRRARQTAHLKRKAAAPAEAQAIAWQARQRLCGRYRDLLHAGKNTRQTTVAVARALADFVWAVARVTLPATAPCVSHCTRLGAARATATRNP